MLDASAADLYDVGGCCTNALFLHNSPFLFREENDLSHAAVGFCYDKGCWWFTACLGYEHDLDLFDLFVYLYYLIR